jgi:hypothetical protein
MTDWNVIVTVRRNLRAVMSRLRPYGVVERTGLDNVLVLRVPRIRQFLDQLEDASPRLLDGLSHVIPATHVMRFTDADTLERDARAIVLGWALELAGKRVHLRVRSRVNPRELARRIGEALTTELERRGSRCELVTLDADATITLDTIDDTAGMARWTREDLDRYPFLRASLQRPLHTRAPLALPSAPSRGLLPAVRRDAGAGPATAQDVEAMLGELDAIVVERILATHATADEVAEAVGAIEDEDGFGEPHQPSSPREAEVRAILESLVFEASEDVERDIARV